MITKNNNQYNITYLSPYLINYLSKEYPQYYQFLISAFEFFIKKYKNIEYELSPPIIISNHMRNQIYTRNYLKIFVSGKYNPLSYCKFFTILQNSEITTRILHMCLSPYSPDNFERFKDSIPKPTKDELFNNIINILNNMKELYIINIINNFNTKNVEFFID